MFAECAANCARSLETAERDGEALHVDRREVFRHYDLGQLEPERHTLGREAVHVQHAGDFGVREWLAQRDLVGTQIETGDFEAPGNTLIDEQQAAVLDLEAVDIQLRGLGIGIGWLGAAQPQPVRAAVRTPDQAKVGAAQEDAVGNDVSAQQRDEFHAKFRALP